jgi:hypothetical protein
MNRQIELVSKDGEQIPERVSIQMIGRSVEHYLLDEEDFHFDTSREFTVSVEPVDNESVKLEITETE